MTVIQMPSGAPNSSIDMPLIDARGHRCPVPTLKLQKTLNGLPPGTTVRLWADDPMAQIDVPHFCNKNNYLLLSSEAAESGWIFTVATA